jgi:hypothetical protein
MITINIMGGLGNQLFQIFTAIATALRNRDTFFFLKYDKLGGNLGHERHTYWTTLFKGLSNYLRPLTDQSLEEFEKIPSWNERSFAYSHVPTDTNNKILRLTGYFQNEKYFKDKYSEICEILQISQQKAVLKQIYNNEPWASDLIGNISKKRILVGTHFRIGDYNATVNVHPIMTIEYYYRAILHVIEKTRETYPNSYSFLVFYDPCDKTNVENKIDELKSRINTRHQDIEFHFVKDSIPDWQQILLMSMCDHNIIANSTFSWWGAYFTENNNNKIVCYPSIWFGPVLSYHDTSDLCLKTWHKIEA